MQEAGAATIEATGTPVAPTGIPEVSPVDSEAPLEGSVDPAPTINPINNIPHEAPTIEESNATLNASPSAGSETEVQAVTDPNENTQNKSEDASSAATEVSSDSQQPEDKISESELRRKSETEKMDYYLGGGSHFPACAAKISPKA